MTTVLKTWSRRHAVALCVAGLAALIVRNAWPVSVVAGLSFMALFVQARGRTTDRGGFGPANAVTLGRLVLILALPAVPTRAFAAAMLAIVALDGLDGFVARRTGTASAFGAHFDMESDGVFVAVVSLEMLIRGRAGMWVLVAGALRYLYVICLWAFPSDRGEEPRSEFGRIAFLLLVLGLGAAWLTPALWGRALAALGCALITLSFARSFLHSYGPR